MRRRRPSIRGGGKGGEGGEGERHGKSRSCSTLGTTACLLKIQTVGFDSSGGGAGHEWKETGEQRETKEGQRESNDPQEVDGDADLKELLDAAEEAEP